MVSEAKITHKLMLPEGLYLQLFVPMCTQEYFNHKDTEACEIIFAEDNSITALQRKRIFATLHDISTHLGYSNEETKNLFKVNFMERYGIGPFSLKDCTKDTASLFIDFLIEECFVMNVPLNEEYGINRAYNITNYLRLCLKYRKCCICGKKADIHHEDAIGMGFDRNAVDDTEKRKMALCRGHHSERHNIGTKEFENKYHVYGIIYNDSDILEDEEEE